MEGRVGEEVGGLVEGKVGEEVGGWGVEWVGVWMNTQTGKVSAELTHGQLVERGVLELRRNS